MRVFSEGFMQSTGMLVTAWPIVLGCDASGVVVAIGEHVEKFKIGDQVFGCTRLGAPGYSTFQEYVRHSLSPWYGTVTHASQFIMDEAITFLKPHNLSTEQAATVGAGLLVSYLLFLAAGYS
jgi:NADPH:quinone reductase-like Zn-dependent oxidoreductase